MIRDSGFGIREPGTGNREPGTGKACGAMRHVGKRWAHQRCLAEVAERLPRDFLQRKSAPLAVRFFMLQRS
ncbi:hypothetical protein XAC71A_320024 [Xanthomonas citri pv. citri]|nr:hypothetical protein XAC71A_320024 [Xanthomonas citri pv. citri]CEH46011.1 hypothetical protein XACLG97_3570003 [Xanthomonas citri pv. citri]CEL44193.1 hypothetical protein XAC439_3990002 [Xanthomonas citri pv. citri]